MKKNKIRFVTFFLASLLFLTYSKKVNAENIKTYDIVKENEYDGKVINEVETDKEIDKDSEIIKYMNEIETTIKNELNSESTKKAKETIVKSFIEVVDFIFYDKDINGIKFSELKEETKVEMLDVLSRIDSNIEEYIPNYKETLEEKYKTISTSIKEKYEEIKEIIKNKTKEQIGEDNYNEYGKSFKKIKDASKDTLDTTKDVLGVQKKKLGNWYREIKNKY